jgi:hypothetical protein
MDNPDVYETWSSLREEIKRVREAMMKRLDEENEERRANFGHIFETINVWRQGREETQLELMRQSARMADCEEELKKQKKELTLLFEWQNRDKSRLVQEVQVAEYSSMYNAMEKTPNTVQQTQLDIIEAPSETKKLSSLIIDMDELQQQGTHYSELLVAFSNSLKVLSEEVHADGLHSAATPCFNDVSKLYESLELVGNDVVKSLNKSFQNLDLKKRLLNYTELQKLFTLQWAALEIEDFFAFHGVMNLLSICSGQQTNLEPGKSLHVAKDAIDETSQECDKLLSVVNVLKRTISHVGGILDERLQKTLAFHIDSQAKQDCKNEVLRQDSNSSSSTVPCLDMAPALNLAATSTAGFAPIARATPATPRASSLMAPAGKSLEPTSATPRVSSLMAPVGKSLEPLSATPRASSQMAPVGKSLKPLSATPRASSLMAPAGKSLEPTSATPRASAQMAPVGKSLEPLSATPRASSLMAPVGQSLEPPSATPRASSRMAPFAKSLEPTPSAGSLSPGSTARTMSPTGTAVQTAEATVSTLAELSSDTKSPGVAMSATAAYTPREQIPVPQIKAVIRGTMTSPARQMPARLTSPMRPKLSTSQPNLLKVAQFSAQPLKNSVSPSLNYRLYESKADINYRLQD